MSASTPVTVIPPGFVLGTAPSLQSTTVGSLHLRAKTYSPNADGSFTVECRDLATLIGSGWSVVNTRTP